jgi:hypothetical protein
VPQRAPRDTTASERLAHIQDLWRQLQEARDPKQRAVLTKRLREETDAYKRATGFSFDH